MGHKCVKTVIRHHHSMDLPKQNLKNFKTETKRDARRIVGSQ
jgi:hypothetical protein